MYMFSSIVFVPEAPNNAPFTGAEDCFRLPDGIHTITPKNGKQFLARCEAGWLILAHRFDGSVDFNVEWILYKHGFGFLKGGHFKGMDNIVAVLQQKKFKARFELTTWENETRYAEYTTFDINDEKDKYRLNIDGYNGTAGDSMRASNGDQFSTNDSDNDGPYWFGDGCSGAVASIFGEYPNGPKCPNAHYCISWYFWPTDLPGVDSNSLYSFKEVKLKIQPIPM
ncbi:unnamed protein product [Owenia fusiformis]|uniref:Uncharacterized protein n=1 Tax=Owenia fusiformis TaxID=6347 RepID=A0A8J1TLP8_OWEFU|nr:unnamed protein product [Owenia fusiformis]